jgi:hypothetical protein
VADMERAKRNAIGLIKAARSSPRGGDTPPYAGSGAGADQFIAGAGIFSDESDALRDSGRAPRRYPLPLTILLAIVRTAATALAPSLPSDSS